MVSLRYRIIVHFTLVSFLCEALSVGNVAFDGGPLIDARCLYRVSFSPVFFPYYFHFFSIFIFWCSPLQKKKLKKKQQAIYIFRAVDSCNNIGLLFFHFVRNGVTTTRLPHSAYIECLSSNDMVFFTILFCVFLPR